jgi:hypothetical protein
MKEQEKRRPHNLYPAVYNRLLSVCLSVCFPDCELFRV